MYIRRKVFSVVKNENGEEKLFSVTQKEFGAHERKQNLKLVNAQNNAQMQAGRAAKAQARVDKMAEILKNGGQLTGKYKDMYENGGYKADVDAAVKKAGAASEKAAQHAKSAEQAAGRVGEVATKMSKKRTSLKEGKELSIQSGNHKGGLKVKMEDRKTLGDIKGKNKKTIVKTEGNVVATQGGGKQTTKTVLTENQQKKVNTQPKIVDAKGKELPKQEIKRETKVVSSAPKTEVKMQTPNKNIKVSGGKVQAELKKDAKKLGKAGKIGLGIAGAAAVGAGLVAAKKYKDKNDEAKKAAVKEFSEKKSEDEKPKKEIKTGDKVAIWMNKHLSTKKDRDAAIKAYDKETQDFKPMAKRQAKITGTVTGAVWTPTGAYIGYKAAGKKGALAGGAVGAGAAGLAAGSDYVGTRLGGAINKKLRKKSEKVDKNSQKTADIVKVADGRMSRDEFAEKYGKEPKKAKGKE
jgi:hypothetical protein